MAKRQIEDRKILQNINGYARGGEMVLVVERPGAGFSSLLKAIGAIDLDLLTRIDGEVRYDGITQAKMLKNFKDDLVRLYFENCT